METKEFSTADVLSAVGGRLVSKRGIEAVYEVLGWMTGESLFTHQLPRVGREAAPVIAALGAEIAAALADVDRITRENWQSWLAEWEEKIGPTIAVPKMGQSEHERIDPFSELAEKIHPDKIVTVRI